MVMPSLLHHIGITVDLIRFRAIMDVVVSRDTRSQSQTCEGQSSTNPIRMVGDGWLVRDWEGSRSPLLEI